MLDRRANSEPLLGGRRETDPQSDDPNLTERHDRAERTAKDNAAAASARVDKLAVVVRNLHVIIPIMFVIMVISVLVSVGAVIAANDAHEALDRQETTQARLEQTQERQRRTQVRLSSSEASVCRRLQQQRERSNVSDARQFLILRGAGRNRNNARRVRRYFQGFVESAYYQPPVDCPQAIRLGTSYMSPEPIPYSNLGMKFAFEVLQAATPPTKSQPVPDCWTPQRDNC